MLEDVSAALSARLDPAGAVWLAEACDRVREGPQALGALFPAVGRRCGRGPLGSPVAELCGWTIDDAARTMLLAAVPLHGDALAAEIEALYRHGDANERRGVLRALPVLEGAGLGDRALPVIRDALRTNDTRLVAAALGPYAVRHLDPAAWRQGVLKCAFIGVPLAEVAGLAERADTELARMFADYANEREAAGRAVPEDVRLVAERKEA
jgi:hypothetical protein